MNELEIAEYRQYVEKLDRDSVVDISKHLDKEKYPDKWQIIENSLNQNHPEPPPSKAGPSFISKLWKGEIPLVKTFWLFWLLPAVAFPVIQSILAFAIAPILGVLYLFIYFFIGIAFAIYQVICIKGVWLSATNYTGKSIWSIASKILIISSLFVAVYSAYERISAPKEDTHDPDRAAEKMAIPTDEFPLAGFYKVKATENFGFAIGPTEDRKYYISFCGPGGCFKPGTYFPNTTILDDQNYQIIDNDTIKFKRSGTLVKRATDNKR